MRLIDFISKNIEPILSDWEKFARSIWPSGASADVVELRDSAAEILLATVADMTSSQTELQRSEKAKGRRLSGVSDTRVNAASRNHVAGRMTSGFDLLAIVSEYRALRASVLRLWRESKPEPDAQDTEDITRFNESIDQSLSKSIANFGARVDKNRKMFLAILGHDLRNPLHAIRMNAELIASLPHDPDTPNIARQIATTVTSMDKMITDLLDFTAGELGSRMPLSLAPANLRMICQQVITEMRANYPEREIVLHEEGELKGFWDAARIRQVISNLVGNALQHGADSGQVRVELEDHRSSVHIGVHNTGEPIPREILANLFDPLVRAGGDRPRPNRKPGSIGLGLYIVREIVLSHGGGITVSSSQEQGTTFSVELPKGTGAEESKNDDRR